MMTTDEGFKNWLASAMVGAALASPASGTPLRGDSAPPPAVNVDGKVQQSIRGRYSDDFIAYVKKVENAGKAGWDGTKWMPHGSPEGGTATLAYGHKLTKKEAKSGILENGVSWKNGISEQQAIDLLMYDLDEEWDRAANYVSVKHGARLDQMSSARQEMLVDMSFNPGLALFPKFTKAVVEGNWDPGDPQSAVNQYKRHLNGQELGRNKHFYRRYFSSGILDADIRDHSRGHHQAPP